MSEATQGGRPSPQEFESVLSAAATGQASFEEERPSLLRSAQPRGVVPYPS